jgi:Flp pilus assembly protein TadB
MYTQTWRGRAAFVLISVALASVFAVVLGITVSPALAVLGVVGAAGGIVLSIRRQKDE